MELLRWARENGCPWDEATPAFAAEGGHLELLRWARENGCPWDERVCERAAEDGHLEMLQWAIENGAPGGFPAWPAAGNAPLDEDAMMAGRSGDDDAS